MSSDHFSSVATAYRAARPAYPQTLYDWLRSQCPAQARVWDVGCGSGQASVDLARHFAFVEATDLSAEQLALAPPRANIHYRQAPAEASGLADDSVDLVTVAQALHWFDLPAFYRELARVLRPGGLFVAWTYSPIRLRPPALQTVLADYYQREAGPWWPPGREHVDNGYRDLPLPWPALPVPALELEQTMSRAALLDYVRSWSASARCLNATGADPVLKLAAALAPLWPSGDVAVAWTLTLRAARRP